MLLSPRPMLNKSVLSLIELGGLFASFDARQQNLIVHCGTFLAFAALVWEDDGVFFRLPNWNIRLCSETIFIFL